MKTLKICKLNLLLACLVTSVSIAQERYKESFNASKDMVVEVNTSHTNVIFETWNKDKVEVEAYVDGENLSKEEKQQLFDHWNLEVLGNSKKVKVNATKGSIGLGIGSVAGVDALKSLESLKSLKALKGLEKLGDMPIITEMPNFNFDFAVPDIPDFEKFPNWPFNGDQPNLKNGNEYNFFYEGNKKSSTFDLGEYKKNKQAYVNKLNKKHNSNISVKQVDNWLDKVEDWRKSFEGAMEEWGENFGQQFSEKFGPQWERKMERWGEEFGEKFSKDMEQWGEEFGEQFGKDMEKWGEQFGKDMEEWAKNFEKGAEKWAQQFEDNNGNTTLFDDDSSKVIIVDKSKKGLFDNKANKTIIIRMPKGTKTEVNVRYGELKMANAQNIKANLNYAMLTANSIDGGETLIDASYAPVHVNTWNNGVLKVNYVEDCRLNAVKTLELIANSSDVNINEITQNAMLSGSFGNLFISKIHPSFTSLDIVLENTDAAIDMPNAPFDFLFVGKKSNLKRPQSLQVTSNNGSSKTMLKGFHQSKTSGKTITISADYSNVSFQ